MNRTVMLSALVSLAGCSLGVRAATSPLLNDSGSVGHRVCTDSYVRPVLDSVVAATFLAIFADSVHADAHEGRSYDSGNNLLLVVPAIMGPAAIYGYARVHGCRVSQEEADRDIVDRRAVLAKAWRLTDTAIIASDSGDCATVKSLDRDIATVDAEFHAAIFARVADIARCLDAPAGSVAPVETYCFDETTDGMATLVCMPSQLACNGARIGLPPGNLKTTCRKADR